MISFDKIKVAAATTCLIAASCAGAEPVAMNGTGLHSCGKFMEFRRQNNQVMTLLYQQWGSGYFAGERTSAFELETITAWADKFCSENPLLSFVDAMDELKKTRKQNSMNR